MANDGEWDPSGSILATGISAGAVWYSLRDLADKAARLPPGEMHDTWTAAAKQMMTTLDEAQRNAKLKK